MFRIGEFSKLTQVSVRMLRYYDEMGLLKPVWADPSTGYRMYSVEQIPLLNKIIYLRDSGFNVSEMTNILRHDENEFLMEQLDRKRREIEKNIRADREKLRKIELAEKELLDGKSEMHYQVFIKAIPAYPVLSLRKVIPDYYAEGELWKECSGFAARNHIAISGQPFSIYHDEDYKEQNVDVEICVPVKQFGEASDGFAFRNTDPVEWMACAMVTGPFSNIAKAYRSFAGWLQKHSAYRMSGENRQIVHRGPWNEENPKNYLVEIQIPLEKKSFSDPS